MFALASRVLDGVAHATGLDSPSGPSLVLTWARMGLAVPKAVLDRLSGNSVCPQWSLPEEAVFAAIRVFATSLDHADPLLRTPAPVAELLRLSCPERCAWSDEEFDGARVRGYWIGDDAADPAVRTVLYIHGGSFVTGHPLQTCHAMCHLLRLLRAEGQRARVFALLYPLAPEHPFPAASDAAVRCVRWLVDAKGVDGLAMIGDSAGGNLVLSALLRLRDEHPPERYLHRVAGAVPISPYVDFLGPRNPPHVDVSIGGNEAGVFTDYLGGFLGRAASRYYTGTKPFAYYKEPGAWPVPWKEEDWDGIWLREWDQILGIAPPPPDPAPSSPSTPPPDPSSLLPARSRALRRASSASSVGRGAASDSEPEGSQASPAALRRRYSFVGERAPALGEGTATALLGVPFPNMDALRRPYHADRSLSPRDLERVHLTVALDPRASPYRARTFAGLPALLFCVGGKELLSLDVLKCARKARRTAAAGRENRAPDAPPLPPGFGRVDVVEEPAGVHVYLLLPPALVGGKGEKGMGDVAGWVASAWRERRGWEAGEGRGEGA